MRKKRLRLFLVFVLIVAAMVISFICKINCNNAAKRFYAQGNEFLEKGDFSNAYYNYGQIRKMADVYKIALLKQYYCAISLKDKKSAQKILLSLIKEIKSEEIRPYLLYNEASLALELELNPAKTSLKKFKYVYDNYPDTDFKYASAYKIAKIMLDSDENLAKTKFLEYLAYAPIGKFAPDALDNLATIDSYYSKEDYETIAQAYYLNKNYKMALENYQRTDFSRNWVKIADCWRGLQNRFFEEETILKGLNLKESSVSEKEVSAKIDRLIELKGISRFQMLQSFYTKYENSYFYPTIIYKLAQSSSSIRAIKLHEFLAYNYSASVWAPSSLWEVFKYNYKQARYNTCIDLSKRYLELYSDSNEAPKMLYWQGRAYLHEKKNQSAKESFLEITHNHPLSYYSFLAAKRLKQSRAKRMIIKKSIASYDINSISRNLFKDKILLELANNGDVKLIDEFRINDEFVKSYSANKKGNYPLSIHLAKNEFEKSDELDEIEVNPRSDKAKPKKEAKDYSDFRLKLIYPIKYEDIINKEAHSLKQSPYLFLSLVRTESHFDKNAKSPVGAIGLTQVLAQTASFVEGKPVEKEALYNPNENIKIGLKYFTYLVKYYNGNEMLAILAYNAGPGNVDKWLKNYNKEVNSGKEFDIDEFIEDIPYLETKSYIKKILSAYWAYVNIYR